MVSTLQLLAKHFYYESQCPILFSKETQREKKKKNVSCSSKQLPWVRKLVLACLFQGKICQTVKILKNFSRTARVETYLVS